MSRGCQEALDQDSRGSIVVGSLLSLNQSRAQCILDFTGPFCQQQVISIELAARSALADLVNHLAHQGRRQRPLPAVSSNSRSHTTFWMVASLGSVIDRDVQGLPHLRLSSFWDRTTVVYHQENPSFIESVIGLRSARWNIAAERQA